MYGYTQYDAQANFDMAYKTIAKSANNNSFIQGVTGIFGFPSTLVVNGIVIFTHYQPMINTIRMIYGRRPIDGKDFSPMMGFLVRELLVDIAIDRVLGHVPIAGAYFNAVSAKALTWRLGMLITIISARGEELDKRNIADTIKLIRYVTPMNDILKFKKPDYAVFQKITVSANNNVMSDFDERLQAALRAFD